MKNNARTLAATLALTLGAMAAAHADSPALSSPYTRGEAEVFSTMESAPSTLTREAVIADLAASRANGTLPGPWYGQPAPLGGEASTLTREQVRKGAVEVAHHPVVGEADLF